MSFLGEYKPRVTYEQIMQIWRSGRRAQAYRIWMLEYERRLRAYERDKTDKEAARYFFGWESLYCNICGGGPSRCKEWCDAIDKRF